MNFENNNNNLSVEDLKREEYLKKLNRLMSEAVEVENYEEAALLRDKAELIKNGGEIVEDESDNNKLNEDKEKLEEDEGSFKEIMENNKKKYIELIQEAIKEAITNDEYDLIDVYNKKIEDIRSGEEKLIGERVEIEFNREEARIGGVSKYSRANEYLREKEIANYMAGSDEVEKSSLFRLFVDEKEPFNSTEFVTNNPKTYRNIPDNVNKKLSEIRGDKNKKLDLLIDFYKKREEAEKMILLTDEKFNSIWQPYCKQNKLDSEEYREYKTHYRKGDDIGYSFTGKQLDELNKIPVSLQKPLEYWQSAYDRSRIILDVVNKAIGQIEND